MRKCLSVAAGAVALLGAAPAVAQEFSSQGQLVFSADRMFGLTWSQLTIENPGPGDDVEIEANGFAFGWRGRDQPTPFDTPRLGVDYFVIDHLSIGGSIAYASYGDDFDYSEFLFSPRVGYVIMFSELFGFWPRGGLTYHSRDDDEGAFGDNEENGLAFTAEAMFLWTPVEHFGITFGPTFDIDMFGERETPGQDLDQSYRSFGIHVGMFGYIPL